MTDLSKISVEELKKELKIREEKKRLEENETILLKQKTICNIIDSLLTLKPKHDRTSCDDNNICNAAKDINGRVRCTRCQLLYIKKYGNDGWGINIEITCDPLK